MAGENLQASRMCHGVCCMVGSEMQVQGSKSTEPEALMDWDQWIGVLCSAPKVPCSGAGSSQPLFSTSPDCITPTQGSTDPSGSTKHRPREKEKTTGDKTRWCLV